MNLAESFRALSHELRYALRSLRKSPAFTATVVTTLALGLGANAAMFGVIDRLMFRPAPFLRAPAEVNRVYLQFSIRGKRYTTSQYPYTRFADLGRFAHDVTDWAAFAQDAMAIGNGDAAREREVGAVSASFFRFFDAKPQIGRFFTSAEDSTPLGASVVVLSDGLWRSEFGARDVLGRTLQVGTKSFVIIGVAPAGFVGVGDGPPAVAWIPITTFAVADGDASNANDYFTSYNWDWTSMIVRRRAGVSAAVATADLTSAYRQSRAAQRAINPRVQADSLARPQAYAGALKTAAGPAAGLESRTLLWVTGVALIVLLIACANVANLMLARALQRQREIAIRRALGVRKQRLVLQAVVESLMLAACGGFAGLLLAQWGGVALRRLVLPEGVTVDILDDWRTLAIAGAFALAAGLITAVGPALFTTRGDLMSAMRADARSGGGHRSRARSALLVLQGAMSVVLLVGAGLFVRSLANVRALDLGYDAAPVLIAVPNMRGFRMDSGSEVAFRRRLLAAAQEIPGVASAARVDSRPFGTSTMEIHVDGIDSVSRLGRFNHQRTTPDYFKVMGSHILRGRAFTDADRQGSPRVMIVSDAMGKVLWPGRDALGECVRVGAESAPCTTVVGIAENEVQQSMIEDQRFMYYVPVEQMELESGHEMFLRVANGNVAGMRETVRRELQKAMPGQSYVTVMPLEDVIDGQRRSWQLGATMFVAFGVLALVVAAVGLYGVIAYNVAQRMHELGVRVALGAQARDIVRLVVAQGISFAAAGVALGATAALIAARSIQPLLFKESATDPLTYLAVGATLIFVAALASLLPALRASRADPNVALRSGD